MIKREAFLHERISAFEEAKQSFEEFANHIISRISDAIKPHATRTDNGQLRDFEERITQLRATEERIRREVEALRAERDQLRNSTHCHATIVVDNHGPTSVCVDRRKTIEELVRLHIPRNHPIQTVKIKQQNVNIQKTLMQAAPDDLSPRIVVSTERIHPSPFQKQK